MGTTRMPTWAEFVSISDDGHLRCDPCDVVIGQILPRADCGVDVWKQGQQLWDTHTAAMHHA